VVLFKLLERPSSEGRSLYHSRGEALPLIKPIQLIALPLLFSACGRAANISSVAPSQLAPTDAFQCVMKTFTALGFQRTMYDEDELRTSARKENPEVTFSSTQFRKTWDRLDVDVRPGSTGTELAVVMVTEAEYFSQNGKNFERVKTSVQAEEAAQRLQSRCAGATTPGRDSVSSGER
jgi:hypothetical protein